MYPVQLILSFNVKPPKISIHHCLVCLLTFHHNWKVSHPPSLFFWYCFQPSDHIWGISFKPCPRQRRGSPSCSYSVEMKGGRRGRPGVWSRQRGTWFIDVGGSRRWFRRGIVNHNQTITLLIRSWFSFLESALPAVQAIDVVNVLGNSLC